jgi:hypothetical protein
MPGKQYRQGDVMIVRVRNIPQGAQAKPRENGRVILAHGEVTGHAHAVTGPAELFDADRGTYLRVGAGASVVHEEHSTIALPPGDYRIIRQREYSPEAIRNVAD